MIWKRRLWQNFRLYVILDVEIIGSRDIFNIAYKTIQAGADVIQLRDKVSCKKKYLDTALKLRKIAKEALLIINDRVDIAKISRANGVHLGQKDLSLNLAKAALGKDKIVGISCHNLKEACANKKADYISIGPIFSTPLKRNVRPLSPTLIKKINAIISIPIVAVGGINLDNLDYCISLGIKKVAVCRSICEAEDVFLTTRLLKEKLIS